MNIEDGLPQLPDDEFRSLVQGVLARRESAFGERVTPIESVSRVSIEPDSYRDNTSEAVEAAVLLEAARRFLLVEPQSDKKKPVKPKSLLPREIESLSLPVGWRYKRFGRHHNVEVLTRPGGGKVTVDFDRRRFVLGEKRPARESQFFEGHYWKRRLLIAAIEALDAEQKAYSVMSPVK